MGQRRPAPASQAPEVTESEGVPESPAGLWEPKVVGSNPTAPTRETRALVEFFGGRSSLLPAATDDRCHIVPSGAVLGAPKSANDTSSSRRGSTCAYARGVMAGSACPSCSLTQRMLRPASMASVAYLWRVEWKGRGRTLSEHVGRDFGVFEFDRSAVDPARRPARSVISSPTVAGERTSRPEESRVRGAPGRSGGTRPASTTRGRPE